MVCDGVRGVIVYPLRVSELTFVLLLPTSCAVLVGQDKFTHGRNVSLIAWFLPTPSIHSTLQAAKVPEAEKRGGPAGERTGGYCPTATAGGDGGTSIHTGQRTLR